MGLLLPNADDLAGLAGLSAYSLLGNAGNALLPRVPPPHPGSMPISNAFRALVPRRRVFLSFQTEDLWAVELLREMARTENFGLFIDESLKEPFDSTRADYIRSGLRDHISRASVTICVIGPTTHESKWVDWELFESLAKGNRVVGICRPNCPEPVRFPRIFRQLGAPVYRWNIPYLKDEIDKAEAPVSQR